MRESRAGLSKHSGREAADRYTSRSDARCFTASQILIPGSSSASVTRLPSTEDKSMMSQEPSCRFGPAALRYARRGWPVLPIRRRGKAPLTARGFKDATTDPRIIEAWARRWPEANVARPIAPGELVVDVDSREALDRLQALDLHLPSTVCATTGRGWHFWYAVDGTPVSCRNGLLEKVDVKASGGYVILPPSIHPTGAVYRWEVSPEQAAFAECPQWVLERLAAPPKTGEPQPGRRRAAGDWFRKIQEPVNEGQRNRSLAEVCGYLFRYLPARVAAELAYCWAQVKLSPPLPQNEVERTIQSIAGREHRRLQRRS